MLYLTLIAILMSFCLGLFFKKIFLLHYNTSNRDEENWYIPVISILSYFFSNKHRLIKGAVPTIFKILDFKKLFEVYFKSPFLPFPSSLKAHILIYRSLIIKFLIVEGHSLVFLNLYSNQIN